MVAHDSTVSEANFGNRSNADQSDNRNVVSYRSSSIYLSSVATIAVGFDNSFNVTANSVFEEEHFQSTVVAASDVASSINSCSSVQRVAFTDVQSIAFVEACDGEIIGSFNAISKVEQVSFSNISSYASRQIFDVSRQSYVRSSIQRIVRSCDRIAFRNQSISCLSILNCCFSFSIGFVGGQIRRAAFTVKLKSSCSQFGLSCNFSCFGSSQRFQRGVASRQASESRVNFSDICRGSFWISQFSVQVRGGSEVSTSCSVRSGQRGSTFSGQVGLNNAGSFSNSSTISVRQSCVCSYSGFVCFNVVNDIVDGVRGFDEVCTSCIEAFQSNGSGSGQLGIGATDCVT